MAIKDCEFENASSVQLKLRPVICPSDDGCKWEGNWNFNTQKAFKPNTQSVCS